MPLPALDMEQLYDFSLGLALPLMFFFGFYFLFAKAPEKDIFENYLRSRRIMGVAMLLLAANYSVHLFLGIRFKNAGAAILMNLSTYFLCYWLFGSALTTLLDRFYITRKRMLWNICLWLLFSALSAAVLFLFPEGPVQKVGSAAMALLLVSYGLILSARVLRSYRSAVRLFEDTHSDDIGAYIRWLSTFTYWAVIFGMGCGLLTFLPDKYVHVWILSSVPFYIYLFCSYMNYMLFYEQVEIAFEQEMPSESAGTLLNAEEGRNKAAGQETPACYPEIAEKVSRWVKEEGYVRPGLTLKELSEKLYTNRTYLSGYINTTYGMPFRDWITGLRLEYAKQKMLQFPQLNISEVSGISGFLSTSHFIRTFKEKEGVSPSRWRRQPADSQNCPDDKKMHI